MAHVMVVDDVADYCREIAAGLRRDDHKVTVATSGQSAIEVGRMLRPQVLIIDWMLKDNISGLDVFEALKVVCPVVEAVMITGFASSDLRTDVQHAEVYEFLEKPFGLEEIRRAVNTAAERRRWWHYPVNIGFIHTDHRGEILFANAYAEDLLDTTREGAFAPRLSDLFGAEQASTLLRSVEVWRTVTPQTDHSLQWSMYSQICSQSGELLFLLLDDAHVALRDSRLIRLLLGKSLELANARNTGHMLIIDDLESVRRVAGDVLRDLDIPFHSAADVPEAMRLFVQDPLVSTIILDFELPAGGAARLLTLVRALRPKTHIIGTSAFNVRERFAEMGVTDFLQKPWGIEELRTIICKLPAR